MSIVATLPHNLRHFPLVSVVCLSTLHVSLGVVGIGGFKCGDVGMLSFLALDNLKSFVGEV